MNMIVKRIKSNLPIDGVKVKNLHELRDHFTIEVISLYQSGQLLKWLSEQDLKNELELVRNINIDKSDHHLMMQRLCEIFDIKKDKATRLTHDLTCFSDNVESACSHEHLKKDDIDHKNRFSEPNNSVLKFDYEKPINLKGVRIGPAFIKETQDKTTSTNTFNQCFRQPPEPEFNISLQEVSHLDNNYAKALGLAVYILCKTPAKPIISNFFTKLKSSLRDTE
ncbi:MAG: hypothetical protein KJ914_00860 [Gammaproteobacteria bacterium]|nr:hypothetical protein [Gammaproteobacteria bacterium]MBU1723168.1 hypothetical protein [Gammaproteobacteria bacterium]MBU2005411.1 hypothetical protein [Gammaproteobacteria bacterium]